MRIIEQFVQAILAIIQARKNGNYKEAVEKIQTASRYYLGTDIDLLLQCSPQQIVNHLSDVNNRPDAERCIVCAELLNELALIFEAQQQAETSKRLKTTALHLYSISVAADERFRVMEYITKMESIRRDISSVEG